MKTSSKYNKLKNKQKISTAEFNQLLNEYRNRIKSLDKDEIPVEAKNFEKLFNLGKKIDNISSAFESYNQYKKAGNRTDSLHNFFTEKVDDNSILKKIQFKIVDSSTTDYNYKGCTNIFLEFNNKSFIVNRAFRHTDYVASNGIEDIPSLDTYVRMFFEGRLVIDGLVNNFSYEYLYTFKPGEWVVDWYNLYLDYDTEDKKVNKQKSDNKIDENFSI